MSNAPRDQIIIWASDKFTVAHARAPEVLNAGDLLSQAVVCVDIIIAPPHKMDRRQGPYLLLGDFRLK